MLSDDSISRSSPALTLSVPGRLQTLNDYRLVMGKIKISSESIPASSEVLWNRFRIVVPESVYGFDSRIGSGIGIDSEIGELASKRSGFRQLHRNRRLSPTC